MTRPTQYQSTDVLITVMTYPHPSRGYSELVCTAGITRSLEWVRLYPVDYRYRARNQQFRKYQWINVGLANRGAGNDNRRPFKFSYVFKCEDNDKPHHAMIEDWELGVLYLKERQRKGSEQLAAQSVKDKYLSLFAKDRDPLLFMGTTFPWNSWVVIGVFYPPKQLQHFLNFSCGT